MESPNDIVGHKTFDTGETCPETGFPKLRHEPMTRAEADALWESAEAEKNRRATQMPDEHVAIRAMWDAWYRLKELGWQEAMYCPKDGTKFKVIENGSTGIFDCVYEGKWPEGYWTTFDEHDSYPSSIAPALFKLYPEDQARYDEKMRDARERFRAEMAETK